jgi:hypothetical protein
VWQSASQRERTFVIDALVAALLDLPVLRLSDVQILLPLLALLIQRPVASCRLRQAGGKLGELLIECGTSRAWRSASLLLQILHLGVVAQLGIQLHQLLFQRIPLTLGRFPTLAPSPAAP